MTSCSTLYGTILYCCCCSSPETTSRSFIWRARCVCVCPGADGARGRPPVDYTNKKRQLRVSLWFFYGLLADDDDDDVRFRLRGGRRTFTFFFRLSSSTARLYIYIYPFHLDRSAENRVELNLKEKKNITISPTHYPFSYRSMSALSHVDGFLLGRQGGRKGRKKKKIFRRSHVCNV